MGELWLVAIVPRRQWVIVGMPNVLVANMNFLLTRWLNLRNNSDAELPNFYSRNRAGRPGKAFGARFSGSVIGLSPSWTFTSKPVSD